MKFLKFLFKLHRDIIMTEIVHCVGLQGSVFRTSDLPMSAFGWGEGIAFSGELVGAALYPWIACPEEAYKVWRIQ
jgi:hypothetical protein